MLEEAPQSFNPLSARLGVPLFYQQGAYFKPLDMVSIRFQRG